MAATMLGQGKNAWQAEIDAAAEVRIACSAWSRSYADPCLYVDGRFLPILRQVRRAALHPAAFRELSWMLEVSISPLLILPCLVALSPRSRD
jgi:hypothetical protein